MDRSFTWNEMAMNCKRKPLPWVMLLLLSLALPRAVAQTCASGAEMDEAARSSLERTARQFFDYASKGDVFNLKQSAIGSLASNFRSIEGLVIDQKSIYAGDSRPCVLLPAGGSRHHARPRRVHVRCVGHTRMGDIRHQYLPPGRYGLVIQDVTTSKGKYALTMVLKQEGGAWKLAGYLQQAGRDCRARRTMVPEQSARI